MLKKLSFLMVFYAFTVGAMNPTTLLELTPSEIQQELIPHRLIASTGSAQTLPEALRLLGEFFWQELMAPYGAKVIDNLETCEQGLDFVLKIAKQQITADQFKGIVEALFRRFPTFESVDLLQITYENNSDPKGISPKGITL